MDWIRNNKFMAGFLAFMLIGVGGLSYLLYTSYGQYDEVAQNYDKQIKELQRLQQLKPYPDDKGLKKFNELRVSYMADVNALQAKLAAYEPPPENPPPTPVQFADKLRKTVEDVRAAAQNAGMALPENFYMGFEQYHNAPPDAAATPLLSRELDALNDLVGLLIKQKAESLAFIKRAPLPREAAAAGAAAPTRPGSKPAAELVVRYPVEIIFRAQPSVFREALNAITAAKRLYVIRSLQVKNLEDKGPLRDDPALAVQGGVGEPNPQPPSGAAPSGTGPNGAPNPPLPEKGPPLLHYVVGLEKIEADLRIELVKVEPPAGGR